MRYGKIVLYSSFLGFSILWLIEALTLGLWQGSRPGPGLMPFLLSIAGSILSCSMLLSREGLRNTETGPFIASEGRRRLSQVLLLLAIFVYLMETIGFILSAMAFIYAMLYVVEKWKVKPSALVAVILPVIFWMLFVMGFKLQLPEGIWF